MEENYLNTISNYVYQKDITIETLTVMEHMLFMVKKDSIISALMFNLLYIFYTLQSHFKLHKSLRETQLIIQSILKDLNLDNCTDRHLKHLSGGERKRVSLGVEVLT